MRSCQFTSRSNTWCAAQCRLAGGALRPHNGCFPADLGHPAQFRHAHRRAPGCLLGFELRVAEFDLAPAVQEDAEPDQVGVRRDLGGDLVLGPRAGSGGGGDVAGRVVPGIWAGRLGWPGLAWAGGAECQPGAGVGLGGAQFGAEGDGAAAVVVGVDVLGEEGESGRFGDARGQDRPPVLGGGGIVEPGALAQEGAAELPVVQAVGITTRDGPVLSWCYCSCLVYGSRFRPAITRYEPELSTISAISTKSMAGAAPYRPVTRSRSSAVKKALAASSESQA